MHASTHYTAGGSKVTKIALVGLLHVGLALAILGLKGPRQDSFTSPPPVTIVEEAPKPPEPEIIERPDLSIPKVELSKVFVPPLPVDVLPPVVPSVLQGVPIVEASKSEGTVRGGDTGTTTGSGETIAPPLAAARKAFSAALANASDCARPDYPARAARNGEVGTVSLALLIGTDGRVTEAKVQKSSGSRDLDRAAVSALSLCKFKPATSNGVAEPAWGQIAYVWSLD